jgi:hypothetical protein
MLYSVLRCQGTAENIQKDLFMVNILQFLACLQNPRLQGEGLGAPDPPAQHLQGLQAQEGGHAGGSLELSRHVGHVVIKPKEHSLG